MEQLDGLQEESEADDARLCARSQINLVRSHTDTITDAHMHTDTAQTQHSRTSKGGVSADTRPCSSCTSHSTQSSEGL